VTLATLLGDAEVRAVRGSLDREVGGIAYDSRRVRPGDVFFALAGAREDGATYVGQALAAGAIAVVGAGASASTELEAGREAAWIEVADARAALALAARRWYGDPATRLAVVAVTGTNGKTTTTWLMERVCAAAGVRCGVIGTTGVRIGGQTRAASLTTPAAPELYAVLREMADRGDGAVSLELSSHALDQRRAYGLDLDVAVFTNLSHDHLDYHGTLDAYLDAKLRMFDGRNLERRTRPWTAVVNLDDPAAPRVVAAGRAGGGRVRGYGAAAGADVRVVSVEPRPDGLDLVFAHDGTERAFVLPMLGRHNAWNAAAAFAAGRALGYDVADIGRGLAAMTGVPGRLERVRAGQPYEVVVDYAHTPDALARALAAAREHARGRVMVVFGCGGDRDRAKRPVMGRIAAERADMVWVTSDNPRSEDPAAIAGAIVDGAREAPGGALVRLELDRRGAIAAALAEAHPGDLVLIAGKGHETTQTIGDQVLPFDDRVVAREQIEARRGGRT
jgi:UDP-N-acetylmuramoyl-L-alanyl-D-glutamate--2,6-diaminopimelate ligase